jgi:phosphate uptake regulator
MFAQDHLYEAMGGSIQSRRGVAIDVRIMVDDVDALYDRCRENGVRSCTRSPTVTMDCAISSRLT